MGDSDHSIAARWGHIQSSLFPWLREEVDPLTEAIERLIIVLDTIGLEAYVPPPPGGPGRPPEDRRALARAFVAKVILGLATTSALVERLAVDKSVRRICGWETRRQVPSEATFSRAFAEFAASDLPTRMHEALVKRTLGNRILGCVARDATEIEAREKPARKDDPPQGDPPSDPPVMRKRGRPKKGEEPAKPPEKTRLDRQQIQNLEEMLADLPSACDVGTKKNSKGFKETWIGYKLHIDVGPGQIPVSCVLTSASVHDSQVAIPLMHMTGAKTTYLYDLMDAAYDAEAIVRQSKALGHVPVIDINFRADAKARAETKAERARCKLLGFIEPEDLIYNFRTMVERINARLKDEFGGRCLRVRGAIKVKCHLMFGILALTVDQIYRAFAPDPGYA